MTTPTTSYTIKSVNGRYQVWRYQQGFRYGAVKDSDLLVMSAI
jgi:hypothetical protein